MDKLSHVAGVNPQAPPDMASLVVLMGEIRKSVADMARLNERNANNERRYAESEERMALSLERVENQLLRVHERFDQVNISVRDEVSSVRDEFRTFGDALRKETTNSIQTATDPIWKKVDDNAKANKDTQSDLDGWINRAKGAWFIGSICVGVFQACIVVALMYVLTEVKSTHDWRIMMEARQPENRTPDRRNLPQ